MAEMAGVMASGSDNHGGGSIAHLARSVMAKISANNRGGGNGAQPVIVREKYHHGAIRICGGGVKSRRQRR